MFTIDILTGFQMRDFTKMVPDIFSMSIIDVQRTASYGWKWRLLLRLVLTSEEWRAHAGWWESAETTMCSVIKTSSLRLLLYALVIIYWWAKSGIHWNWFSRRDRPGLWATESNHPILYTQHLNSFRLSVAWRKNSIIPASVEGLPLCNTIVL